MYVLGWRLSLFRLCGSNFGITPADDVTNLTTYYHLLLLLLLSSFIIIIIIIVIVILMLFWTFIIYTYIELYNFQKKIKVQNQFLLLKYVAFFKLLNDLLFCVTFSWLNGEKT